MNTPHDDKYDALIDEAARAVRDESLSEAEIASAARRVGDALAGEGAALPGSRRRSEHPLLGCEEMQALLPARHDGTLARDRALLVDEHLKGCVTCRAAYKRVRTGAPAVADRRRTAPAPPAARRSRAWAWAAAAAVLVAVGAGTWLLQPGWFSLGRNTATVAELEGLLLNVGRVNAMPIARGAKVAFGETMRTGKDAGAVVVLADGSRIELAPRTEMTLSRAADGTDIRLGGGQVIVEASKQGSGHLYVTTADSRVAVKGTVFSVLSGAKGTRVSVLEGAVEVDHGSERAMLTPGQQFTSSPALSGTTLEDEIGWSLHADKHRALLAEFTALSLAIDALPGPAPRTSTRLMDLMPQDAVLYAALPNLSGRIDEAWRLFLERAHGNETLGAWWREHAGAEHEAQLSAAVDKIRLVGGELGDEVAIAALSGDGRPIAGLAVVATLKNEASFRALIEKEAAALAGKGGAPFRLVAGPADVPPDAPEIAGAERDRGPHALYLMTSGDLMLAASGRGALEALATAAASGRGGFAGTPLHAELAAAYRDGAVWLGGIDVATLIARSVPSDANEAARADARQAFAVTGLAGAKLLVVEGDGEGEASTLHATLVFDGPRKGALAWLAEPSPMGALRFVSPDATLAVAAVVKDPV
ncbi:MAG: putative FecR, partial [Acidobacteria bacterium]|nr:putative FecR [Acidobacteriota bacterium]